MSQVSRDLASQLAPLLLVDDENSLIAQHGPLDLFVLAFQIVVARSPGVARLELDLIFPECDPEGHNLLQRLPIP